MDNNSMVKENQPVSSTALGQCPSSPKKTVEEGKLVKFVFSAIRAKSISVAGTFNNWTPGVLELRKDLVGIWRGSLRLKPGTYQYRYCVDGKWVNDPCARNTVLNEFGTNNTVLEVR